MWAETDISVSGRTGGPCDGLKERSPRPEAILKFSIKKQCLDIRSRSVPSPGPFFAAVRAGAGPEFARHWGPGGREDTRRSKKEALWTRII